MPRAVDRVGQRILVVDHDGTVANAIVALLRRNGYRALAASDAASAIHTARHFQPNAAIIEVFLSDLNGVELSRTMLEMLPNCKLVLMTGSPVSVRMLDIGRARGLQFDLLLKPLDAEEVVRSVRAALQSKQEKHTSVGDKVEVAL